MRIGLLSGRDYEAVAGWIGEVDRGVADVQVAVPALREERALRHGVGGREPRQQRIVDAAVHVREGDGVVLLVAGEAAAGLRISRKRGKMLGQPRAQELSAERGREQQLFRRHRAGAGQRTTLQRGRHGPLAVTALGDQTLTPRGPGRRPQRCPSASVEMGRPGALSAVK